MGDKGWSGGGGGEEKIIGWGVGGKGGACVGTAIAVSPMKPAWLGRGRFVDMVNSKDFRLSCVE